MIKQPAESGSRPRREGDGQPFLRAAAHRQAGIRSSSRTLGGHFTTQPHLMRSFLVSVLATALGLSAAAAPAPSPARPEITALLSRLQSSNCTFNRNGTWYSAPEAKEHLLKKLEYLEGKSAVQTAEQFIELAASSSSMSGKPYLVRCGASAPEGSKSWLSTQLKAVRSSAAAASAAR